jgi:hypothetical protein
MRERTKRDVYYFIVGRTLKKKMVEVRGKRINGRRRGRKIKIQIRNIKEKAEEEKKRRNGFGERNKKHRRVTEKRKRLRK